MESNTTFSVQFTGEFLDHVDPQQAIAAFAALAKISVAQAGALLGQPRCLKKQLTEARADTYLKKLEAIGLQVVMQPEQQAQPSLASLSLEPIDDRYAQPGIDSGDSQQTPVDAAAAGAITCPKCGHQQNSSVQCESCGVYLHKVKATAEQDAGDKAVVGAAGKSSAAGDDTTWEEPQDPKPVAIVAAAAVALVSAYLWKLIAVVTEYEVGIVAWAIGGAIGFTAIALGSVGIRTGVLCGVLALCSIVGGKYLVQQAFMNEFVSEIQAAFTEEGLADAYSEQMESARYFADYVQTDAEMREFMVEYGYTEATDSDSVTDEELRFFKEQEAPYLVEYANNPVSVDDFTQMQGAELVQQFAGFSTWDAVKESLGPIDFLFFFLGVGTAFRLGSTGRAG